MSEIKVGDLVMLVQDCCTDANLGMVFRVQEISNGPGTCNRYCGTTFHLPLAVHDIAGKCAWPLPWLKKLDGLPSSIEHKQTEEV